jgi:hypothetical protein
MKVGMAGAAVLATAQFLDASIAAPVRGYRVLDSRSATMVAAFIPVVLEGSLPSAPAARERALREVVEAFDRAVYGLSPSVRKEVEQLFSVMRFSPTRIALTGLWAPVEESSREEIAGFLSRWRQSKFDIQRAGYQALTQLIQAAWFDNQDAWAGMRYPGPPSLGA